MSQRTGRAGSGFMMIGHNRPETPIADLLDHSAAQIREYHQIGSLVGNFIQRTLIELPEEERFVVYIQPLQGCADDSSSREPIRIHVRDHEKILLPANLLGGILAEPAERVELQRDIPGVLHI